MKIIPNGIIVVMAAGILLVGPAFASGRNVRPVKGKYAPPPGKVLVFVGQTNEAVEDYVRTISIVPAGFSVYSSIQKVDGLSQPVNYGAGYTYADELLADYPHTALQIGLYMVDALDAVTDGVYDRNIDKLGAWIQQSGRPVFLRIGYEFDIMANHYMPRKYIRAYRHIVQRLRRNGVSNVAFVWHSRAVGVPSFEQWYPGDDYVDWVALSYFNQPKAYLDAIARSARRHRKPLMIAVSCPASIGTVVKWSWKNWFEPYFEFVKENDVRAMTYANANFDNLPLSEKIHWGDCRLASSADVHARWTGEMQKDSYLHASPWLFDMLGSLTENMCYMPVYTGLGVNRDTN